MSKAFGRIFWGAVITLFNINIGWLNLLPTFAGYILIAAGLSKIMAMNTDHAGSAKKAAAFAWVLAVYTFATMFMNGAFGGITNSVLSAVFMTADMLMCYFVLSSGVHHENRETVLKQQRNYLLIATVSVASCCVGIMMPGILWVTLVFIFMSKIYFIYLCHAIKRQYNILVYDNDDNTPL